MNKYTIFVWNLLIIVAIAFGAAMLVRPECEAKVCDDCGDVYGVRNHYHDWDKELCRECNWVIAERKDRHKWVDNNSESVDQLRSALVINGCSSPFIYLNASEQTAKIITGHTNLNVKIATTFRKVIGE